MSGCPSYDIGQVFTIGEDASLLTEKKTIGWPRPAVPEQARVPERVSTAGCRPRAGLGSRGSCSGTQPGAGTRPLWGVWCGSRLQSMPELQGRPMGDGPGPGDVSVVYTREVDASVDTQPLARARRPPHTFVSAGH